MEPAPICRQTRCLPTTEPRRRGHVRRLDGTDFPDNAPRQIFCLLKYLHTPLRDSGFSTDCVRTGKVAGLLVARMDRLSRSVVDGAELMEQALKEGWALHFADLDIDTSTPAGEMLANIIITGSRYEGRLSVSAPEMHWRPGEPGESDSAQRRRYR